MGNHKVKRKPINSAVLDVLKIVTNEAIGSEFQPEKATEIRDSEGVSLSDERPSITTKSPEKVLEENIENFKQQFYTCGWQLR